MSFKAWQLAAMEEHGYMDTNTGLITRLARYLSDSPNSVIETEEFRSACYACRIDPRSITQNDLEKIQSKLNELR